MPRLDRNCRSARRRRPHFPVRRPRARRRPRRRNLSSRPISPSSPLLVVAPARHSRPHARRFPLAQCARCATPATLTKLAADPKLWEFCALSWSAQGTGLSNDFEKPVFRRHPGSHQIKRVLLQKGAAEASLAGSGSAVFGVFPSPAMARRAAVGFPHDQTFVCETISRDRYLRAGQRLRSVVRLSRSVLSRRAISVLKQFAAFAGKRSRLATT